VIHREFDTPGFTWQLNFRTGQEKMKNYLSPGFDYTYLAIDEFKHLNLGGVKESSEFQAKQNMYQNAVGLFLLDRIEPGPHW
jgi:hypothetical protein